LLDVRPALSVPPAGDEDCPGIMACLPAVAEFSGGVYEKVRTIGLDEALASLPPSSDRTFLR